MKVLVNGQLVAVHGGIVSELAAVSIVSGVLKRQVTRDEIELQCSTWSEVRIQRNSALSACDYTQVSDTPLPPEQKQAWSDYRQKLRDVTDTFSETGPESVIWPEKPA